MEFKRLGAVVAPQLKITDDTSYFVRPTAPIYAGKDLGKVNADGSKEKPADLMKIVNLQTGDEQVMVVNAVVKGSLQESFPEDSYVGKNLEIIVHPKTNGKRYKTCSMYLVDVTQGEAAPATEAATTKKK